VLFFVSAKSRTAMRPFSGLPLMVTSASEASMNRLYIWCSFVGPFSAGMSTA
jgi:hypothetical protein